MSACIRFSLGWFIKMHLLSTAQISLFRSFSFYYWPCKKDAITHFANKSFWSWFGMFFWPRIQHFTEWDFLNYTWIERDKAWMQESRGHPSGLYAELMCLRTHRWGRWWARIPAHTRDTCTRQKQTRSPYRECMSSSSWPLLYGSPVGERGKRLWCAVRITSGQKTALLNCRFVTQKGCSQEKNLCKQ